MAVRGPSWSSPPDEGRFERFRRAIASKDELFLVAELDEAVIAFGSVVVSARELRSLYVHPRFGRQGLGAALLRQLEQVATATRIPSLQLTASVNAERFYARHGYELLGRGTHRSGTGMEMDCVNMKKDL